MGVNAGAAATVAALAEAYLDAVSRGKAFATALETGNAESARQTILG